MNRKSKYFGDSRYEKVFEQMKLLGIQDVSTKRQEKNGTIVWMLPIKKYGKLIEVASFKTGYVRNQNSGYSNYQLNERDFEDEYFQDYEWKTVHGEYQQVKIPGQYRKWRRKTCKLIPIEIDRLEYLISYCLKNYYIKQANMIEDGKFVPKWKYENMKNRFEETAMELSDKYTWSGGEITDNKSGEKYVHEQHAYWNKWKEDKPSSVEIIIDGHKYKVK